MSKLPYKAALVTGAARRIGQAIAFDLAAHDVAVAVHHNGSEAEALETIGAIQDRGGKACIIQADLTNTKQTQSLISEASNALKLPIDILVNNASVFQEDNLETLSPERWDLHQNVNLRAPTLLTQAFADALPAGHTGCIINIIDQRVYKLNPQYMSYTASKAGLLAITKTTAQALAPKGIRVNGIGPGPTLANDRQSPADFASECANVPLGAGPSLEEITGGVRFILETPSLTGQMIALDGGQHLAWRTEDIVEA